MGRIIHPKPFRSTCITLFVFKIVEKVIDKYIRTNALTRDPLHPCEHAYQTGPSTETTLYQLTDVLTNTIPDALIHKPVGNSLLGYTGY